MRSGGVTLGRGRLMVSDGSLSWTPTAQSAAAGFTVAD